MLAHSGPGLSNTNCSSEVNWRVMKGAVLCAAGSTSLIHCREMKSINLQERGLRHSREGKGRSRDVCNENSNAGVEEDWGDGFRCK